MKKFKVGDHVRVVSKTIGWPAKSSSYFAELADTGGYVTKAYDDKYAVHPDKENAGGDYFAEQDLRFMEVTMDNLEVGTVLESGNYHYDREVLQVTGYIIVTRDVDDGRELVSTANSLKDDDWAVKAAEPEVKELTLQEVADLAGVDVDKIRIKE